MLSLVSLALAWRVRALFFGLLPVVSLLVFSTVALRYHYVVDVLAGAAAVAPGLWLSRLLYGWGSPPVVGGRPATCSGLVPPARSAGRGTGPAGWPGTGWS